MPRHNRGLLVLGTERSRGIRLRVTGALHDLDELGEVAHDTPSQPVEEEPDHFAGDVLTTGPAQSTGTGGPQAESLSEGSTKGG